MTQLDCLLHQCELIVEDETNRETEFGTLAACTDSCIEDYTR